MKKAIVLLSGGQDSTTCLYWAKRKFDEVVAIGFDYGQSHRIEIDQAKKIAEISKVHYELFNVKGILGWSSLVNKSINHNEKHFRNENLPASFTAGRNILFLTIASSFAYNTGIKDIVSGVCQTDFSGYPDCRREFIDSMERTLELGLGIDEINIHTPLMSLTKAETFKLAKELGCLDIILRYTMTDYNGNTTMNEWGMGAEDNPASIIRANGYREAKEKGWI